MRVWLVILATCLVLTTGLGGAGAFAQQATDAPVKTPVLTIDWGRFLRDTQFGQRLANDFQDQKDALQAEYDAIEKQLSQEEEALVQRRNKVSAEEFRKLSQAFDEKVVNVRLTQRQRRAELPDIELTYNRAFTKAAGPILFDIVKLFGASVLIDKRNVILDVSSIDITQKAIDAMDKQMGNGGDLPIAIE